MALQSFKIIPILGRKTSVPQDDMSLLVPVGEGVALSHDVGGANFDLSRKRNACSKSYGYAQWSNTANATATKCLGLFQLYDGTNTNRLYADNGVIYYYNATLDPVALHTAVLPFDGGGTTVPTLGETLSENGAGTAEGVLAGYEVTSGAWADGDAVGNFYLSSTTGEAWSNNDQIDGGVSGADMADATGAAGTTTFATDNQDLYSSIRVGSYWVFTDRGEAYPFKWKHGQGNLTPLNTEDTNGVFYKFRYLESFQRRIIGMYSDQTDGNIEIRWSTAWPTTSIDNLYYPSSNQLWIPNDDPIVGGRTMGKQAMYIYCENSIQQLAYVPDYANPFRIYTVVPQQGGVNHHSIVNLGDRHYFFNPNYGFCEYRGGYEFPYGGVPISEDIETDIQDINSDYHNLIVGTYVPLTREVVWTVPMDGNATPNILLFYNIDKKTWRREIKEERYLDFWQLFASPTWTNLTSMMGATWYSAGFNTWASYAIPNKRLVFANTDGQLYSHSGETTGTVSYAGTRVEPIMDFGNPRRSDLLEEVWFDIAYSGDFDIEVKHRWGNTVGEITGSAWYVPQAGGLLSCNDVDRPVVNFNINARLHQIKWGTNATFIENPKPFVVNGITFKYSPQSEA